MNEELGKLGKRKKKSLKNILSVDFEEMKLKLRHLFRKNYYKDFIRQFRMMNNHAYDIEEFDERIKTLFFRKFGAKSYQKPEKLFSYPNYDEMIFMLIKKSKYFRLFNLNYIDSMIKNNGKNPVGNMLAEYTLQEKKFLSNFNRFATQAVKYYNSVLEVANDIKKIKKEKFNIDELRKLHYFNALMGTAGSKLIIDIILMGTIYSFLIFPLLVLVI